MQDMTTFEGNTPQYNYNNGNQPYQQQPYQQQYYQPNQQQYNQPYQQPIYNPTQIIINQPEKPQEIRTNGIGKAGFVLSIISVVLCWVPIASWVTWFLGLLFSFIGLFKSPKGLAIAGFIISIIDVIIIIAICFFAVGFAGLNSYYNY